MTGQLAPPRHLRESSSRQPTLEKPALLCPLVQAVLGNESMGVQRTTLGTHRVRGQDGATLDAYLGDAAHLPKLAAALGCPVSELPRRVLRDVYGG